MGVTTVGRSDDRVGEWETKEAGDCQASVEVGGDDVHRYDCGEVVPVIVSESNSRMELVSSSQVGSRTVETRLVLLVLESVVDEGMASVGGVCKRLCNRVSRRSFLSSALGASG